MFVAKTLRPKLYIDIEGLFVNKNKIPYKNH